MNLTSKTVIKKLLREKDLKPFKGLGQNFLVSKLVLKKFIKSANLKPNDIVLEIGPGIGTITQELARRVKKVIAIEKDPKISEIAREVLKEFKNVKIVNKDILKVNISSFKFQVSGFKIIGNLPFYLTSPVIRKFLEDKNLPQEMILIIQKEVAQRICAKPPQMNFLAVLVQFYAQPKIISSISKKSFWPQPKIDSAIIKIIPYQTLYKSCLGLNFRKRFFRIVSAGFSHPRKQLVNNLSKGLVLSSSKGLKLNKEQTENWLLKNKIKPSQRAESLTIKDWIKLTKNP